MVNRQRTRKGSAMQHTAGMSQTIQESAGSAEPRRPWILGLIAADDDTRGPVDEGPYSFLSECECPDTCLRDHDNE